MDRNEYSRATSSIFGPNPFSDLTKPPENPEIEEQATPIEATPPPSVLDPETATPTSQCPASPTLATPKTSKATGFGSTYTQKPKESYLKKLSSSSTKSEPLKKLSTLSNKSTKSEPGGGKSSNPKPKSETHREIWTGPKKWKSARTISLEIPSRRTYLSFTMDMRRMKLKQKQKIPPLEKKIKPNPKYENIQSSINSGNNTRKQLEKMEEIKTYYKFRPDEIFRRITVTSLATLMIECSKLEYQEEDSDRLTSQIREDQESLQKMEKVPTKSPQKIRGNAVNGEQEEKVVTKDTSEAQINDGEEEVENKEAVDDCDADSLDSAIDPEEHRAFPPALDDHDEDYIDSVVFKGRKILKKTNSLHHQHLQGSLGNLLQGFGEIALSPRSINDMSDRTYHHHDSTQAASTFQLDAPPSAHPPRSVIHVAEEVVTIANEPTPPKLLHEDPVNSQYGIPKKRDRPYLILDIRDQEQYKQGRIVTSKSYPAVRLSRSVNYETRDMYRFKNVQGKIIVIADSDESLSAKFATTMIQRGYDNVFVLSGGLRVARIKFPEQLITPCEHDVDDQDDFDETVDEDQIHIIEAFLEEALTSGTSRLSSVAPSARSGWPSRISSSQSNLPSLTSNQDANGTPQAGIRHKPRQVPLGANYYPPRPQRTSAGSRRS